MVGFDISLHGWMASEQIQIIFRVKTPIKRNLVQ